MLKILASIISIGVAQSALAGLIPLDFSGSLNRVSYSDCLTYHSNGSCDSWSHSYPTSSSFFEGNEFAVGNSFSGSFVYDSDATYSLSIDGFQAVHLGAISEYALQINGYNLPSYTLPLARNGSLSIVNDRNGYDSFFVSQWFSGTDWFSSTYISLGDNTGQIYDSFDIPEEIDLNDFSYASFHISFLRRSDGDQLHLYGNVEDLQLATVSEPSSLFLFGAGCLGLFLRKKRICASRQIKK
jgi:hypothetical protein